MAAEKKNTFLFCLFVELLMPSVPDDKPFVLVMDNASYHHSHDSQALLAYFKDRSMVVWLPPYCSDLNPIESFWGHLKDRACASHLFKSMDDIVDSVGNVPAIQNDLASSERLLFSKT